LKSTKKSTNTRKTLAAKMNPSFVIEKTRDNDNCLDLRFATWPNNNKFSKYIVFANGRTEWIEKYHYIPQDLELPDDFGFVTWDHRGQGDSGGARAMIDHYDSYAQDTSVIVNQTTEGRPFVVMSHSMGGLISLYATLKGYINPKALVLSSPLLRLPQNNVPGPIAKVLSKIFSELKLESVSTGAGSHTKGISFETNSLTHSYDRFLTTSKNPFPIPGATFGWINQTFAAIEAIFSEELLANLNVPVLVIHGSDESVVDITGFRDWVKTAQKYSKSKILYRVIPGARHELYSEIDQYYNLALALTKDWFQDFIDE